MINFVLIRIAFSIIGIVIFLFIFWNRLREDYSESIIFTSAFYVLFGMFISTLASLYFFEKWWFWLALLGGVVATWLAIFRFKLRVFEVVESNVLGSLTLLSLVYLYNLVQSKDILSGSATLICLALIILFIYFDKHYKDFTWYKSGRIGFSGLTILGLFFLIRAAVALFFHDMISFVSGYEVVLSGIIAFVSFLTVFNLAKVKS
ncbi:hypothetical protein A2962_02520 [Candidatus Woesebacteria bacterium RIFCSPLOWO2_01_FULL_39_61]|uniref:Uncharacterized protein n=1 Tax=Candidatus Woesebacteria bacterium RIFCSPHIGHO2_02_FULL_39_13 TaxID=1802505 RepID=A0A1F7YWP8_9BACT|nr:MAG: hypothetical protein A2692_02085 [Candidatus Woesebacteria bacterium RIFCSPHIGHO2_01_FULL_39_95]OGM31772.1 MAG: hypothetical protein A3D01_04380 [Candidatus Woesebacteria bacterium RIFCSPHIGHO2_02_FULL_39_13]OGM36264.1 MAG: hypothetical protein A3E13_03470 [Candidatus Woesebacteria bacterium RIFCSPHIGHO2_12_FULL_40_20]OGM68672.1 MAG: hypothetical protein A2962_02520 [Candidatus Woesebacteria bacterium RIFCSPLOWO2_01_FULL_39_61]OGM72180.1 MAG: hypothetical protein A3H19_06425 [Candidatus